MPDADRVSDAVVVGAGPNGLVAANLLADAGWSVTLLEAKESAGGGVRTEALTAPGFRNDVFSAFYPLAAASPVFRALHLDEWGLRWSHAPTVLAHPRLAGATAILHRDPTITAQSLERDRPGDGAAYRRVQQRWAGMSDVLLDALLTPFPPIRHGARLVAANGLRGTLDAARLALLPVRQFVEEEFGGQAAALLFAGNALHADFAPETAGSALFGSLLVGLGQAVGFPVPVGGAGRLTDALVARSRARGVEPIYGAHVERIVIDSDRAVGVVTRDGDFFRARRAVLADCDAPTLLLGMVGEEHLSPRTVERLTRFRRGNATFKVDWALSSPVPWTDPAVGSAGTVHIAESLDELTMTAAELATSTVPSRPFILVGQMTTSDPMRSPAGTESLWAYTHVPQSVAGDAGGEGITGSWDDTDRERFAERIEQRIEELAPGFRDRIVARHLLAPTDFAQRNPNLVGGDIGGGTAQLHQQLVFRPLPGLGRAETGIRRLYLASASAHPGGGVHGACGANAARAAIFHDRISLRGSPIRRRLPRAT